MGLTHPHCQERQPLSCLRISRRGPSPEYNIRLLEKCQAVKKEQVMRCLREYVLKLFKPESSVAIVVTAPGKLDEIVGELKEERFQVDRREIVVQDDGNSDESTSDLGM